MNLAVQELKRQLEEMIERKKAERLKETDKRLKQVEEKKLMERLKKFGTDLKSSQNEFFGNPKNRPYFWEGSYFVDLHKRFIKTLDSLQVKGTIPVKITKNVQNLLKKSEDVLGQIKLQLKDYSSGGGCLGCASSGQNPRTKVTLANLVQVQTSWKMINELQAKDIKQVVHYPEFAGSELNFIETVLKKHWPQNKSVQQKIVYVQKHTSPDRLKDVYQKLFGYGQEQNPQQALQILSEECSKKEPNALCLMGRILMDNKFLPRNLQKSIQMLNKAIEGKSLQALYLKALLVIQNPKIMKPRREDEISEIISLLKRAAEKGHSEATVQLGNLFQNGYFLQRQRESGSIAPDPRKARECFEKAIKLSDSPRAANSLAVLISKFQLSQNQNAQAQLDKAFKLFSAAKEKGNLRAVFNLARCHEEGWATPKNKQLAFQLYEEGSRRSDQECILKYTAFLLNSIQDKDAQLPQLVQCFYWLSLLSEKEQPNSTVFYYLGIFMEFGYVVEVNKLAALGLFTKGHQLGSGTCANKIGNFYFSGFGVEQDFGEALKYYQSAAELGSSQGMVNLGLFYLDGYNIVEADSKKATSLFMKAMTLKNADAFMHMAILHLNDVHLDRDEEVAIKLLKRAQELGSQKALDMLIDMGESDQKLLIVDEVKLRTMLFGRELPPLLSSNAQKIADKVLELI